MLAFQVRSVVLGWFRPGPRGLEAYYSGGITGVCEIKAIESHGFVEFGAMQVTKPCEFGSLGDVHGPTPYKSTGFRLAFISQTPVLRASA